MDILEIKWDKETLDKVARKHHLEQHEVEEVFQGKNEVRTSGGVYHAFGTSESGKYIFVVFRKTNKQSIRIITAMQMTKDKKRLHRR